MEPTPDTSSYLQLGYGFFFLVMAIYVASMYIRNRSLKRDLETLESIQAEEKKK